MAGLLRRALNVLRGIPVVKESPSFPEKDRLFFMSPSLLLALNQGQVLQPYRQHVWVYAAVNAISQNIANVPLSFYTGSRQNKKLLEDHALVKLFDSPNPTMSGGTMREAVFIWLCLKGEAFTILERQSEGEIPRELWVLPPDRFKHVVDAKSGLISGWIYQKGADQIPLLPYEVISHRFYNPYDDYRGLAPLAAAKAGIDQDWWASQYNAAFFQNGAIPGGVIEITQNLNDDEFHRLRAQWEDRHQGASKAQRIAILEGGAKYTQTGLSQKDMDWLEGRKWNREEILAAFKVPKGEVGLFEDDKYANSRTQRKLFWTNTLLPKMSLYEYDLYHQLLRNIEGGRIWAEHDLSGVEALQEDFAEKLNSAQKTWAMGVPFNIVNERFDLGFPAIEGGDLGYLPFNLSPVGQDKSGKAVATPPPKQFLPLVTKAFDAETYWQNYVKLHTVLEGKVQSKIKRYFYEQRRKQLQHLEDKLGTQGKSLARSIQVEDLLIDLKPENDLLKTMIWPLWFNVGEEMGKALIAEVGADPEIFNLVDTPAMAELQTKLIKVVGINDTVREQLRDSLAEGTSNMETAGQLADRVRQVYNFAQSRSLTIARTETGQAASLARNAAMEQLGVEKIRWVTAGDEQVRVSHQVLNGQTIKQGEKFSNGLRFPCDPNGTAKEIIACRCCSAPAV